ncbi:MAG: hypothetical protein ACREUF_20860 [Solimonas sp.]
MSIHSRKQAAVDFLRRVASGEVREAYRRHAGPASRHHSPCFRFEGERIAKLWDRGQPVPGQSPNEPGMF